MACLLIQSWFFSVLFLALLLVHSQETSAGEPPRGMVLIHGGEFTMGSEADHAMSNEGPPQRVPGSPVQLDIHPVTIEDFAKFVTETGYVTNTARSIDWEVMKNQLLPGIPKPTDEALAPGSLAFRPTRSPVDLPNMAPWWKWPHGASWEHPESPGSGLKIGLDHRVVHVAWGDAQAYARRSGKRLPTEAEWEFSARGGLEGNRFAWVHEENPEGRIMANRWTGNFPYRNDARDGFEGTTPVGSFPTNAQGLHDMGGNVWNGC